MTFLWRACAVSPRFSLGMIVLLCVPAPPRKRALHRQVFGGVSRLLVYRAGQSRVRQHRLHRGPVARVHLRGTTQVALAPARLLGEDVPQKRLGALDAAARLHAKALFGAALGFHLGHESLQLNADAGWLREERFMTTARLVFAARSGLPGDPYHAWRPYQPALK